MSWNRHKLALLFGALALALPLATSCAPQAEEQTTPEVIEEELTQTMSYATELQPVEGVTTTATGSSTVEFEGDSATYSVTVQDLSGINSAHIHIAEEAGGQGPPAVWLFPSVDAREPQQQEGVTSGELSSGTFEASDFVGPLEGMTMDDLIAAIDDGRAYVNVHTAENPDGEITGFLRQ